MKPLTKSVIKRCAECGRPFKTSDKRQEYCLSCRLNREYEQETSLAQRLEE